MLTQILHTAKQRNKFPRRSYKFPRLYKSTPPSLLSPFLSPPPPLSPFLPPPPATPLHFKEVTNVNELQLLPVNIAPPLCSRKANLLAKYLPSLEVCYESRFKWYQSTWKYLKFSVCWPHCRDRARESRTANWCEWTHGETSLLAWSIVYCCRKINFPFSRKYLCAKPESRL